MSTIEKHDMTQGKILLPLVSFTIPLVLGNLFQLTYNAADSVIVGKYVGEQALAAVGTSTPIMNIAILLISGMCMGASVIAPQLALYLLDIWMGLEFKDGPSTEKVERITYYEKQFSK